MTTITLPVESMRAHDDYIRGVAYEVGVSDGRALMALERGLPDRELMLRNAYYAAGVTHLFQWLAFASPVALLAERLR